MERVTETFEIDFLANFHQSILFFFLKFLKSDSIIININFRL